MKPSLQLKLSQHLTLTPQLQQSIRLLQLSTLELNQEIERFLLENPMLERDESEGVDYLPASTAPPASSSPADERSADTPQEGEREAAGEDSGGIDWSDLANAPAASSTRDRDNDEEVDFQEFQAAETSLREHLNQQIALSQLSDRDRALARLVIEALDDDGYLHQSLEDLRVRVLTQERPLARVGAGRERDAVRHGHELQGAAHFVGRCPRLQRLDRGRGMALDDPRHERLQTLPSFLGELDELQRELLLAVVRVPGADDPSREAKVQIALRMPDRHLDAVAGQTRESPDEQGSGSAQVVRRTRIVVLREVHRRGEARREAGTARGAAGPTRCHVPCSHSRPASDPGYASRPLNGARGPRGREGMDAALAQYRNGYCS